MTYHARQAWLGARLPRKVWQSAAAGAIMGFPTFDFFPSVLSMNTKRGEHRDKKLPNGVQAHIVRFPGETQWRISSLEVNWGGIETGILATKRWFPEPLGIADRVFSDPDDAYLFVEKHARLSIPIPTKPSARKAD